MRLCPVRTANGHCGLRLWMEVERLAERYQVSS